MSKIDVKKAQEIIKDTSIVEARGEADTVRLWESYREQALMWRGLSLFQLPVTLVAICMAFYMWSTREITLKVPRQPLPSRYTAQEVPNAAFMDAATNFINLISNYNPRNAERQFEYAGQLTSGEFIKSYRTVFLSQEYRTIQQTQRTQTYYIDPSRTKIEQQGRNMIITFVGERGKFIGDHQMEPTLTQYTVTLTTIPRNPINPYGIAIIGLNSKDVKQ